jgi:PST family polysaccharide transporter
VTVASASLFILNGVGIQHRALLSRAMRFTTIAKIDLATQALGTCLAIGMAALGFGYWALVWQAVSSTAAAGIAMWIVMPWRPSRPGRTAGIRSMVRLGGTVTANGFVVYLAYNAEKVLLGRFWGAEALGIYGRAYQLATLPVQQLINAIGSVAFPVLSRMQNDPDRFHRSFLKFHSIVVSLIVPVVVSCGLFGEEIVGVLFGPKWNGVGAVLRLLSPTALVFALINPFYWLLISTGRAGRSLKIAFLLAPAVLLGIAAGLRNGPTGVALGYSAAMVALIVPTVARSKHETGVTTATYWDAIKRPLVAGAIGGAAGWCFKAFIATGMSPIPLMLGELTVSCAVYALVLLVVLGQKTLFAELLSQLMQKAQPVASEV